MGKSHKKKIAELSKEAENENSQNEHPSDEKKRSSRNVEYVNNATGHEGDSGEENGENDALIKSGKKRKSTNTKNGRSVTDEPADTNSKKARQTKAPKSKGAKKEKPVKNNESDEEEYEVQSIVDHKMENGTSLFLIRWKGYTKDDDTWEPEDTLSCDALIAKFKKSGNFNNKSPKGKGNTAGTSPKKNQKNKNSKSETEEYEVDKIINYAEEKSGRMFLIRWKGYSAQHDTWEPEKHLHCDDMIKKFMKRMSEQENVAFKELREEPKKTKRLVNETVPRRHYASANGRASKRAAKKRVYYGDSEN